MSEPPTKCPHGIVLSRWDADGNATFCLICYPKPQPKKGIARLRKHWNKILADEGLSVSRGLFVGDSKLVYMRRGGGPCGEGTVDESYRPEDRGEEHGSNTVGQDDKMSWLKYKAGEPVRREKELVETLSEMFLKGSCTVWAEKLGIHPQTVQRIRAQLCELESREIENAQKVIGGSAEEWRDVKLRRLLLAARAQAMRDSLRGG